MIFVEEIKDGVMLTKCSSCGERFEVKAKELTDFIEKNPKCSSCRHEFDFTEIEYSAEDCMPIYDSAEEEKKHEHYKGYMRSLFYRDHIKPKD